MKSILPVAILEDQPDIAQNLQEALSADDELRLLAVYSSAEEALKGNLINRVVRVFLVDLSLPGLDGIQFIVAAKKLYPQAEFLVHTILDSGDKLYASLSAGALGYVLKGCSSQELINALKMVAKGNTLVSPRMATKLMRFFAQVTGPVTPLSEREKDILTGLKNGLSYDEIAASRFLSTHTVHTHIKKIYRKLHVGNRNDAIQKALTFKVIDD